jgi:hypothetical protein
MAFRLAQSVLRSEHRDLVGSSGMSVVTSTSRRARLMSRLTTYPTLVYSLGPVSTQPPVWGFRSLAHQPYRTSIAR